MKNINKYLVGAGLSSFGDGLQAIASSWLVLKLTGNPLAIGGAIAINYLPPLLLAPWAGAFADHRDSKRLAVLMDVIRFLLITLMTLMVWLNLFSLWAYYVLLWLYAISSMFFKPASQTLLKETFPDTELVSVLSKASTVNNLLALIGSGTAGLLISVTPIYVCMSINAFSFLISALCNFSLSRVAKKAIKVNQKFDFQGSMQRGWLFLYTSKGMLYLLFMSIISSFAFQMMQALQAPYVMMYLGNSSTLYAVIDITFTLGGSLAGLSVQKGLKIWGQNVCLVTLVGMAAMGVISGFRQSITLVIVSMFGMGYFIMFHLLTMQILIQINTPKEIVGSVIGLRSIVASLTKITAALSTAMFLNLVDIRYIFWGFVLLILLVLSSYPKIRTIPIPDSVMQNER
ncbi:hypothetical protein AMQ84_04670 [Paenibacillus riograndensis]|uniref:Major facilitator superfamily (MFS) profile domain-containing protein n=1 Tax=Paenibacillus riograndensis TaxID=483937 RepID=A0A132U9R2_9BACL|nr:MFS transporter [Paenibacillus riograndensis]KWX80175.1 hypothetical protein AMQ84_04670 [Paenibacillus riograndensis]